MSWPPRTQPSRRVKTRSLCSASGSAPSTKSFKTNRSHNVLATIGENIQVNEFKSSRRYDATYNPKKPEASESQYVTSEIKERLYAICPTPKRCMVTLESAENNPIEICHILARQTREGYLELLEQHWGMRNSLNIDVPENLTFMRVDMHRSFDRGDWALFPELDLLNKITLAYTNNDLKSHNELPIDLFREFQGKQRKPYRYRLVWLKDIDASTNPPILRRRLAPTSNHGVTPQNDITDPAAIKVKKPKRKTIAALEAEIAALQLENIALREEKQHIQGTSTASKSARLAQDSILPDHQIYSPPYVDFPLMESHVHPLFVIYNAGEKLSSRAPSTNFHGGAQVNRVALAITYLFNIWRTELQLDVKPHDNGDEDDGGEGGDDRNDGGGDGNDNEGDDEDNGNDGEDGVTGAEDEGREDDHDDNASDENVDDNDEGSHHGHGGGGHDGNSSKPQEHTEKDGQPQRVQDAAQSRRDDSTHFDTSTGTPELVGGDSRQGSVKPGGIESEDARHDSDTSDYGDLDGWIAEWAASAEPESNIKLLTNDHQLKGYRKEPARQPPFEQWKHWAHSPPEMPDVIHDHDDTSHYTSYLWSLYHRDVNLLAPDGSRYWGSMPWNRHLRI